VEESVALCRELGDKHGLAFTLTALAHIVLDQGNATQAAALAQESLTLARDLHNKPDIADALYCLARSAESQGEYGQAEVLTQENLALARELGDKDRIARALSNLGEYALYRGDFSWATTCLEECLSLMRELGFKYNIAFALHPLGELRRMQGDVVQAAALHTEGLALAREVGSKFFIGYHLVGLAKVAAAEAQPERAVCLFGASAHWLNPAVDFGLRPREDYKRAVENLRAQLGEEAFAAAWERGLAMTPEQALAEQKQDSTAERISSMPQSTLPAPLIPTYPDGLTRREVEVLRLVALGWGDAQVAEQLVISPRTVNGHLRSIYNKINVNSRSAATRYAIEHPLIR
jgi:ATP/maltotriose-dependent transcriptional regulator MalT